jgi:hypothetical protein
MYNSAEKMLMMMMTIMMMMMKVVEDLAVMCLDGQEEGAEGLAIELACSLILCLMLSFSSSVLLFLYVLRSLFLFYFQDV